MSKCSKLKEESPTNSYQKLQLFQVQLIFRTESISPFGMVKYTVPAATCTSYIASQPGGALSR